MVIRNCLQLLLELSSLEEKIAKAQAQRQTHPNHDKELIRAIIARIGRNQ